MYVELHSFLKNLLLRKSIWTDGELWTSIAGAIAAWFWLSADPSIIGKIRAHFGDLLDVTSIIFGFALAALLFYIQAASAWAKDERIIRVAERLIDWHVWTILCLLFLIGYILALWSLGAYIDNQSKLAILLYDFLVFQSLYCGTQILNHTLTVWWSFRSRDKLTDTAATKTNNSS